MLYVVCVKVRMHLMKDPGDDTLNAPPTVTCNA